MFFRFLPKNKTWHFICIVLEGIGYPKQMIQMKCKAMFSWKNTIKYCQIVKCCLTFTTLLANSADDKLVIFFLLFPENRFWHFMQIVSSETICMKYQKLFSWKNKKNISKCCLLKILPRVLSVNYVALLHCDITDTGSNLQTGALLYKQNS